MTHAISINSKTRLPLELNCRYETWQEKTKQNREMLTSPIVIFSMQTIEKSCGQNITSAIILEQGIILY